MAASATSMGFSEKDLPRDVWLRLVTYFNEEGNFALSYLINGELRPCELYKEEYSDCKSIRGRFHQYYVYGENQNCQKWKEDYDNCIKFRNTMSREAAEKVLEHERERREARLSGARGNDVWEYRRHAPSEWHAPLNKPTAEDSVLAKVQEGREMTGTLSKSEKQTSCVVS